MLGLGMGEMVMIGAVLLLLVGPKKIPELAKGVGEGIGQFKKALTDLKQD
jgi:TatA/E family protein of Tat protein translocase